MKTIIKLIDYTRGVWISWVGGLLYALRVCYRARREDSKTLISFDFRPIFRVQSPAEESTKIILVSLLNLRFRLRVIIICHIYDKNGQKIFLEKFF